MQKKNKFVYVIHVQYLQIIMLMYLIKILVNVFHIVMVFGINIIFQMANRLIFVIQVDNYVHQLKIKTFIMKL